MPDEPIEFEVANEFARVAVRRVETRNGMRLEISSPRLGSAVQLDALLLESLSWQTDEVLARFLQRPFEPIAPEDTEENQKETPE